MLRNAIFCLLIAALIPLKLHATNIQVTSSVLVTNNTREPLTIHTTFNGIDLNFMKGRDWDSEDITIKPYATKNILWFNRFTNVQPQIGYHFNVALSCATCLQSNQFSFGFDMYGKNVLGSYVYANLYLPQGERLPIFQYDGLNKMGVRVWDKPYNIYTRTWLPLGKMANDFHIVIDNTVLPEAISQKPEEITVLSYNTQLMPFYADVVNDLNQPGKRVKIIPDKIRDYDVVILQELFDFDLRQKAKERLKLYFPYHSKVVGEGTIRPLTGGVMIFSKWPIIKEHQIVYAACDGLDCASAKGAGYVAINKQGKKFHIFGTHLQADAGEAKEKTRLKQLEELHDFILCLDIPTNEPVIIGGDFNMDEYHEKSRQTLASMLRVEVIKNIGYPFSVDGEINTMNVHKDRAKIDYIFYSLDHAVPKQAMNEIYVLRDLDNESMWPKFDLSDHFPVASRLDFSN